MYGLRAKLPDNLQQPESTTRLHTKSVNITPSHEPQRAYSAKAQVAFRGFLNWESMRKFAKVQYLPLDGKLTVTYAELYPKVREYISPTRNSMFKAIGINLNTAEYGIGREKVIISKSLGENLISGFTDFPKFIGRSVKNLFSKEARIQDAKEKVKEDTQYNLLGLWVKIDKTVSAFDKVTSLAGIEKLSAKEQEARKATVTKFKELLANRTNSDEAKEKLADFLEENKLKDLYSVKKDKDGKVTEEKGLLKNKKLSEHLYNVLTNSGERYADNTANQERFLKSIKRLYVNKVVDKTILDKQGSFLPSYGQSMAQFTARVVSGLIPAWYIANDFYNLRMTHSNDKKQAKQEWKSKFGQESFRIAITAYQGYVLNNVFELLTNKSLPFAVFLNIVNTIGSNILSRVLTKRPVLPIDADKAQKINKSMQLKKAEKAEKENALAGKSVKPAFSGAAPKLNTNDLKAFEEHFPHTIAFSEFKKIYEDVKKFDKLDAAELLQKAAGGFKKFGIEVKSKKLKLEHIEEVAKNNNNNVILGTNSVYKQSNNVIGFFTYPFTAVADLSKWTVNKGISFVNLFMSEGSKLKPLKSKDKSGSDSIQFVKNVSKWAELAKKEAEINAREKNGKPTDAQVLYSMNKKFLSPKTMDYGADQLSTVMKITGLASVPFLAADAHNVTYAETGDKDEAKERMKQRATQDTARQGISFWFVKTFNRITRGLSNGSLPGNALAIGIQTVAYESATRMMIGQPIFRTSHEEMQKVENERNGKKRNWFVKIMAGKIKTASPFSTEKEKSVKSNKIAQPVKTKPVVYTNNQNPQFAMDKADFHSARVEDLYKKFQTNNQN
jgi:hypothetical protein